MHVPTTTYLAFQNSSLDSYLAAECSNELFTEPSGYVISPGYPDPYPPNLNCNYSIRVEAGLLITLKFLEPFEIDDHQQVYCPYDQLKVLQIKSPLVGAIKLSSIYLFI